MMAAQSGNNDAASSGQGISSELGARDLPSKRLIGKGLASIVYETEWNRERVARKDFIGVPSGAFQKEAAILVGLKDHENVVKTHARTVDKMSCSLVLEYMEEDLLDVLQKRKESQRGTSGTASDSQCEEKPSYPFELAETLAIFSQIARGMEFLHEQDVSHGDLKTKNILVSHLNDGDKNLLSVKVADFGLVRTKSKSMSFVSRQARKLDVVQWKAPEVLERLLSEDNDVTSSESDSNSDTERPGTLSFSYRLSADVYSFAVTCSQILTGEGPYPNGNWKELGSKIVSGELRPNLPAACPGILKRLLESCWTKQPAERPTFSEIRERLEWLVDAEVPGYPSVKEMQEKYNFFVDNYFLVKELQEKLNSLTDSYILVRKLQEKLNSFTDNYKYKHIKQPKRYAVGQLEECKEIKHLDLQRKTEELGQRKELLDTRLLEIQREIMHFVLRRETEHLEQRKELLDTRLLEIEREIEHLKQRKEFEYLEQHKELLYTRLLEIHREIEHLEQRREN